MERHEQILPWQPWHSLVDRASSYPWTARVSLLVLVLDSWINSWRLSPEGCWEPSTLHRCMLYRTFICHEPLQADVCLIKWWPGFMTKYQVFSTQRPDMYSCKVGTCWSKVPWVLTADTLVKTKELFCAAGIHILQKHPLSQQAASNSGTQFANLQ